MSDKMIDFKNVNCNMLPIGKRNENPIIGISVNIDEQTSRLHEAYIRSILDAGGVPILIPATNDIDALREIVDRLDGILFSGGADIDGRYFGEETLEGLTEVDHARDTYDFLLLRLATDRQLPIFGICRGMQLINVAFGGGMYQDIPSQFPNQPLDHSILKNKERAVHQVKITTDSVLSNIIGKEEVGVNSRHHQTVKEIAPGFKISATSTDGVVEGIEAFPEKRIWGVQWHPENMASEGGDVNMKKLFERLILEAKLFRKAKLFHNQHISVDSHCDTPMLLRNTL